MFYVELHGWSGMISSMSWRTFRAIALHWGFRGHQPPIPDHIQRGNAGEQAAREFLEDSELRFLVANFRSKRGEIDLVFQARGCLVFVEVKTRSAGGWSRPAAAVNREKRLRLTKAALDYLHALGNPRLPFRFDIVEVWMDGDALVGLHHIPNAFSLSKPYRYG